MDLGEHSFTSPFLESAPARATRRKIHGDVLPAAACAQQPKNTLKACAIVGGRPAALGGRWMLRKGLSDAFPVFIGKDSIGVSHDWLLSPITPAAFMPNRHQLFSCQNGYEMVSRHSWSFLL